MKDNQAVIGLNLQSTTSQVKKGQLTWALNAVVEGVNGESVTYQNEEGADFCAYFPEGYRYIGGRQIKNFLFLLLANPTTVDSEIGRVDGCTYSKIINAPCLGFSVDKPIHNIEWKETSKTLEVYWTDGGKRRFIDLLNLPYKEIDVNTCNNIVTTEIDCNKLSVQPNFSIPTIKYLSIGAGNLTEGTYQFGVQYANALGDAYTSYYGITNPLSIFDLLKIGQDYNLPTGKSISVLIENIDDSGVYDYINIAVISTINNIVTPYLLETRKIQNKSTSITYTGEDSSLIKLDIADVFNKFPIYDNAEGIFTVQDVLGWYGLTTDEKVNYQEIASKLKLQWETHKIPVSKAYKDGITTAEVRGYFRDEVYAPGIVFYLANGKQTDKFPLIGRQKTAYDVEVITNADANINNTACNEEEKSAFRWQVYNTASKTDRFPNIDEDCYEGPYEYGEFAYWESTEVYPCDESIWGDLAGKPIRHFKFPDCSISPHHDDKYIYPIGFKIDVDNVKEVIRNSRLTETQKRAIVGFKIVRGNRAAHKSITAKGLIYNVGEYTRDNSTYFYPNYPFNDLRKDPFLSYRQTTDDSGKNENYRLDGFLKEDSRKRFTFHSPDTHFYQPALGNLLKIEGLETGHSKGHFVQVKNHSKYKFLSTASYASALGVAIVVGIVSNTVGVSVSVFNGTAAFAAFESILGVIDKLLPRINFAYQFNSVGEYTNLQPVNEGNILRDIDIAQYIVPGLTSTGDIHSINNYQRESSVYLRLITALSNPIVEDQSRWIPGDEGCDSIGEVRQKPISAYYASIKRNIPNLYSTIHSFESVDTGFYQPIDSFDDVKIGEKTIFGGDVFINRFGLKRKIPFFLDNRVSPEETNTFPDDADVFYNELNNVANPIFWMSTDFKQEGDLNEDDVDNSDEESKSGLRRRRDKILAKVKQFFGVKINNFDCRKDRVFYQNGKFYLFAYGIPYFYVESEVNVDARRAFDNKAGDFFPHVGQDIPDDWLQETHVSIQQDNSYNYNKTFSKQNKENLFTSLLESDDLIQHYPNKAIYSDQHVDGISYKKNNWLLYRSISEFDFPLNYGKLTSIDGIENKAILARFEEKSLIYNALLTTNTSNPKALYLGNDTLFKSSPPIDFAETDLGWAGSQNKFLLKTENGSIFTDAKRGQVFLVGGTQAKDITGQESFMQAFFLNNLPFKILNYFPQYPTDNHFNGVGITGVYDSRYDRLILTKLDYVPLNPNIKYANKIFTLNNKKIELTDPLYFANKSFTISFDFNNGCWISLHSYLPNFYIGSHNTFYSGNTSLLKHFSNSFLHYGDTQLPYILEYPISDIKDNILQSITDYTKSFKNTSNGSISSDNYFNKTVISNNEQSSGVLNLIKKPINKPLEYLKYPKYNIDSRDILYTKNGSTFHFNQFWDILKDPTQPIYFQEIDKTLNTNNLDYTSKPFKKYPIRGTEAKIRLILDDKTDTKLISQFILAKDQPSYK